MSEKRKEMFEYGRIPEIEKRLQPQYGGLPCLSPGKAFHQVREKEGAFSDLQ